MLICEVKFNITLGVFSLFKVLSGILYFCKRGISVFGGEYIEKMRDFDPSSYIMSFAVFISFGGKRCLKYI